MARVCEICGKGTVTGHKVSNAKNHNKRVWKPNLLKMKTEIDGRVMSVKVCTRCLRTGSIVKKV
ncbi:MAG: 50S ribosomal protein L28 [Treponemataceae bacterium]